MENSFQNLGCFEFIKKESTPVFDELMQTIRLTYMFRHISNSNISAILNISRLVSKWCGLVHFLGNREYGACYSVIKNAS